MANSILEANQTDTAYRGRFTSLPSHLIPDGFSPYLQDVDLTRQLGTVSKRRGTANESTGPVDANTKVTGLHQFITSAGSTVIWASAGSIIYDATVSGAWVNRYAGAMAGARVNFATFNDLTIAVSETEATQKSSGAAFAALLGSPPANVKFVRVFKNRLLLFNSSAGKSRLHWSAPGDPENYAASSGGGFQDLDINDGSEGMGIAIVGGAAFLFKRHSVWMMTGVGPPSDTFAFRKIAVADGCVGPRTIVEMGNMAVWLSDTGVYGVSEAGVWADLSPNIVPTIRDIAATAKGIAAAGQLGRMYVLDYDSNADGVNDQSEVLDVENGAWSGPWKNQKANVFTRYLDGSLISGGSDAKNLRRHDTGEDDLGTNIEMIIRTRGFDGNDFTGLRLPDVLWFEGVPVAAKSLTVRTRIDGVQTDTQSVSLTAGQISGTDRNLIVDFFNLPSMPNAKVVEWELYNNESAAPVRLYRWRCDYKTMESQKLGT